MTDLDLTRAAWRRSSHSASGAEECVEITGAWRKSSYSEDKEGECVEVARASHVVAVRDSKHPEGPVLAFTRTEWRGLLSHLKYN